MHIITHTKSSEKPKYSSAPTTWLLWRKQNYRECKRWMVWKPFHTHRRRNEGWIGVNRGFLVCELNFDSLGLTNIETDFIRFDMDDNIKFQKTFRK